MNFTYKIDFGTRISNNFSYHLLVIRFKANKKFLFLHKSSFNPNPHTIQNLW